jgi:hypothetical protein
MRPRGVAKMSADHVAVLSLTDGTLQGAVNLVSKPTSRARGFLIFTC